MKKFFALFFDKMPQFLIFWHCSEKFLLSVKYNLNLPLKIRNPGRNIIFSLENLWQIVDMEWIKTQKNEWDETYSTYSGNPGFSRRYTHFFVMPQLNRENYLVIVTTYLIYYLFVLPVLMNEPFRFTWNNNNNIHE